MEKHELIERSIIKKFRHGIWSRFIHAVQDYKLVQPNDKIAVCISGGKDSFLLAKCMQELQRHGNVPFELVFLVMNPGYKQENVELINSNAQILGVPVVTFESDIFEVVDTIAEQSPCYLCAKMRRGFLYRKAAEYGCNKIALGHHFNDVIETTLLSMLYAAEIRSMMPKLKSSNVEGMELIRPLYNVREDDIIAWSKYNGLKFLRCACRFTERLATEQADGKRQEIKRLIKSLCEVNPQADLNIFNSIHNVNLDTVIRYKYHGKEHNFLDYYDD